VRVRSEHFFGSLKGRFQSLRELRFQIQGQKELDYANMWVRCCLVLHNLIVEIEEGLGIASTAEEFYDEQFQQGRRPDDDDHNAEDGQGDESYIGTAGQNFRNSLMAQLHRVLSTQSR